MEQTGRSIPIRELTRDRRRPFYVYDIDEILRRARKFTEAGFQTHFAVKSNGHSRILRELAQIGVGADVVSLGELRKALQSGVDPRRIIFSGVAKVEEDFAVGLEAGIYQFNVESFEELQRLAEFASDRAVVADVALRLNLDIYAPTHPYIQTGQNENKFGLDARLLPEILPWLKKQKSLRLVGLAVHVGSQIMELDVFKTVCVKILEAVAQVNAQGFEIRRLDLGGGLGLNYQEDGSADDERIDEYLGLIRREIPSFFEVSLEPGRILSARAGILVGQVLYVKKSLHKNFAILNTGSHHLVRPALYQAFHRILPVHTVSRVGEAPVDCEYDFVGPLCESSDFLALGRKTSVLRAGDWVAIMDAGAYGRVMASRYNEHEWPGEICVKNGELFEVNL